MNDPLNINIPLEGKDTSFPLIPEADYPLTVVESSISENYEKNGQQWNVVFGTTEPTQTVNGDKVLPVGTRLYPDWPLQLQPRADGKGGDVWDGSAAQRSLCVAVDAFFGSTKENRPAFTNSLVTSTIGCLVIGHVVIDTDKNGVQRNKVTRLKKAA